MHDVGVYYRAQAGATLKYIMVVDNAPVYFTQLTETRRLGSSCSRNTESTQGHGDKWPCIQQQSHQRPYNAPAHLLPEVADGSRAWEPYMSIINSI
jgi:hypothetical protein